VAILEPTLGVMKLSASARLPRYITDGAAGLDLYMCADGPVEARPRAVVLVPTGIAVAIPSGYVGLVKDRSSLAAKGLHTLAGVIDSDYRGEIKIAMYNATVEPILLRPGDRIAQMLVLPCPQVKVVELELLPPSGRGSGGFGSTGR